MICPDEWSEMALQDVAVLARGKFSARPRNSPKYFGGEYPFVQTGDVRNARVKLKEYSQTLNEAGLRVSKLFPKGTLLFTIAANIGEVAFLGFDGACPDSLIAIYPKSGTSERWLYYQLGFLQPAFEAAATQNAQLNINLEKLNPFRIPFPPIKEQEAIAQALSDADALIEGLERLIAKKRLIKQGAMQDLLTAKRRLPGFSGEWAPRKLGSRGQFFKGAGVRKDEANSGLLPCVRYGELYTLHDDVVRNFASFISVEVAKTARPIKAGDILFAGSGETKEEIGKCAVVTYDGEMYAGGDIIAFRPTDDDPIFLSYVLNAPAVQQQKARRGQGDAVVHISATALGDLDLLLPNKDEQSKISAVLEDMDVEIQALETRLEKARQVKEGMMQNLLTGRIRLV